VANGSSEPGNRPGLLSLAQAWLPVLTVVGGALWGLFTYIDHAKQAAVAQAESDKKLAVDRANQSLRESRTRLIEAQKPFLDRQLALYFETAKIVGRLVTEDVGSPGWADDETRFNELYWSELTMVEHAEVAAAMVGFRTALSPVSKKRPELLANASVVIDRDPLRNAALGVAHALRKGVEQSWGNGADGVNTIVAPFDK